MVSAQELSGANDEQGMAIPSRLPGVKEVEARDEEQHQHGATADPPARAVTNPSTLESGK